MGLLHLSHILLRFYLVGFELQLSGSQIFEVLLPQYSSLVQHHVF